MKGTELTVTQKPALKETFGVLAAMLTKENQKFLIRNNNFEKPKVIRHESSIEIENWPYDTLEESQPILDGICHDLKHLYADGDRCGHRGIKTKGIRCQELQNNDFRMNIIYSYSLIRESADSPRKIVINFSVQDGEDWQCPRLVIGRITPINMAQTELDLINNNTGIHVDAKIKKEDTVALVRRMSKEEEERYFAQFIHQCAAEFREYLNAAYKAAVNSGKSGEKTFPDYALTVS